MPTNPCCCSAPTCVIDITGYADIANYTQVSGSWSNGAGDRIETSSANALAYFNTPHPESLSTGGFYYRFYLPTTGAVRAIFAYQDANNYLFHEVEAMPSDPACEGLARDLFHRIGSRTGGVDTILETRSVVDSDIDGLLRQLCYNGERLMSSNMLDGPLTGTWGTYVAFEAIGITGTAGFDLVEFDGDIACTSCISTCSHCGTSSQEGSGTPSEWSLYFDGVVNDVCDQCDAMFNGMTFVVSASFGNPDVDCERHSTRSCGGSIDVAGCEPFDINATGFVIGFGISSAPSDTFRVDMFRNDGRFDKPGSEMTQPFCNTVWELDGENTVDSDMCDWSSATCEVTPNIA